MVNITPNFSGSDDIPYRVRSERGNCSLYFLALIEWKQIRTELIRAIDAAQERTGMTQAQIAAAAGLSRQGYISQVQDYSDDSVGPGVMNLVKLLEMGLGMKVSAFFAVIELRSQGQSPPVPPIVQPANDEDRRALEIGRLYLQAHRVASGKSIARPRGRPRNRRR